MPPTVELARSSPEEHCQADRPRMPLVAAGAAAHWRHRREQAKRVAKKTPHQRITAKRCAKPSPLAQTALTSREPAARCHRVLTERAVRFSEKAAQARPNPLSGAKRAHGPTSAQARPRPIARRHERSPRSQTSRAWARPMKRTSSSADAGPAASPAVSAATIQGSAQRAAASPRASGSELSSRTANARALADTSAQDLLSNSMASWTLDGGKKGSWPPR
mmetsp:Transcript_97392/g.264473  ORF Transcript_97392/g.264473 Transcript_97392/m.264473 type:complete len:220 (-) Transcript_97392:756-1415(-)